MYIVIKRSCSNRIAVFKKYICWRNARMWTALREMFLIKFLLATIPQAPSRCGLYSITDNVTYTGDCQSDWPVLCSFGNLLHLNTVKDCILRPQRKQHVVYSCYIAKLMFISVTYFTFPCYNVYAFFYIGV